SPGDMWAADFDNDGLSDLAVVDNVDSTLSVFLSTDGGPPRIATFHTTYEGGGLASGDLNGDRLRDIVVATPHSVSVFINDGGGQFPSEVDYAVGTDVSRVAVADFNGDGWDDVVAAVNTGGFLVFPNLGTGDGSLGSPVSYGGNFVTAQ